MTVVDRNTLEVKEHTSYNGLVSGMHGMLDHMKKYLTSFNTCDQEEIDAILEECSFRTKDLTITLTL